MSGGHPLSSSASAPNTAPPHRHSAIAYGELPTELVVRYTSAARTFGGLSSEILAAIGDIESAHVTIGDATVDPKSGAVRPPAVGPPRGADPFNFLITTTTWAARRRTTLSTTSPTSTQTGTDRHRIPSNRTDEFKNEVAIGRYNLSDAFSAAVLDRATERVGQDTTDQQGDAAETVDADVNQELAFAVAQLDKPCGAEGPDAFDCSGPSALVEAIRSAATKEPDTDGDLSVLGNGAHGVAPLVCP